MFTQACWQLERNLIKPEIHCADADASAGLEGPDLCLVLKELSGVMCYQQQKLTIDSSASIMVKAATPTTVIDLNSALGNQQYQYQDQ